MHHQHAVWLMWDPKIPKTRRKIVDDDGVRVTAVAELRISRTPEICTHRKSVAWESYSTSQPRSIEVLGIRTHRGWSPKHLKVIVKSPGVMVMVSNLVMHKSCILTQRLRNRSILRRGLEAGCLFPFRMRVGTTRSSSYCTYVADALSRCTGPGCRWQRCLLSVSLALVSNGVFVGVCVFVCACCDPTCHP